MNLVHYFVDALKSREVASVFAIACLPLGRRVADIAEYIWISAVTTELEPRILSFLSSFNLKLRQYNHHDTGGTARVEGSGTCHVFAISICRMHQSGVKEQSG